MLLQRAQLETRNRENDDSSDDGETLPARRRAHSANGYRGTGKGKDFLDRMESKLGPRLPAASRSRDLHFS